MDSQLAGARKRIAAARRRAEAALKRAFARVPASERVEPYLPAWREYASALRDAVGGELLEASGGAESCRLAELKASIVEEIMPDVGLARATLTDKMIEGISIVWEMATGLYYEERRDGTRTLARDEILAALGRHGDWERLSPACIRYVLRRSKEANALVRAALDQELTMGAYAPRASAVGSIGLQAATTARPPGAPPGRQLPPGIELIVTPPPADPSYVRAVPAEYPVAERMPEQQTKPATTEPQLDAPSAESQTEAPKSQEDPITARAAAREAFVRPILRKIGITASRWATKAGVDPSVVYDYLSGRSKPMPDNRIALAKVLGVPEADLPL
jgi:hypothetical protein